MYLGETVQCISKSMRENFSSKRSEEVVSTRLEEWLKITVKKATSSRDSDGGPTSAPLQKARGRSACYP